MSQSDTSLLLMSSQASDGRECIV